jgi:hypothetical protein
MAASSVIERRAFSGRDEQACLGDADSEISRDVRNQVDYGELCRCDAEGGMNMARSADRDCGRLSRSALGNISVGQAGLGAQRPRLAHNKTARSVSPPTDPPGGWRPPPGNREGPHF